MKARTLLLILSLGVAGTVGWSARNREERKTELSTRSRAETLHPKSPAADGIPELEPKTSPVPESNRHAQGDVQKEQAVQEKMSFLNQSVRDQEDKVEEKRKMLDDRLIAYAAKSNFPNEVIKTRYPAYLVARRELDELHIKGLGERHPTVQATQHNLDSIRQELHAALETIRPELQAKLLFEPDGKPTSAGTSHGFDQQDYVDANRDFETDLRLLEELKAHRLKIKAELSE